MFFGYHPLQALKRRHRRSGADLGRESMSAAGLFIQQPIGSGHPFVRSFHFDSGDATELGLFCRRRRNEGIGPLIFFENVYVHLFDIGRRRIVAAVQPYQHARMVSQAPDLIRL